MCGLNLDRERNASERLLKMTNWGRWGEEDERGAANFITSTAICRGALLVKRGIVYPLGNHIRQTGVPMLESFPPPLHFMAVAGSDYVAGLTRKGDMEGTGVAADYLISSVHGVATHVDALCHFWREHTLYNGFPEGTVRSYGALRLGIENLEGIATRGVLLDIATYKGRKVLEWNDVITDEDLMGCAKQERVTVESGDVVLIRTGWSNVFHTDPKSYGGAQPGLGPSAGLWLAEREVVAVGADNSGVQLKRDDPSVGSAGSGGRDDTRPEFLADLHSPWLWKLGIYFIEMMNLERLAQDKVYEFFFIMAPLLIKGGTGSPVNPLAIV